jgi:hypothetical protein
MRRHGDVAIDEMADLIGNGGNKNIPSASPLLEGKCLKCAVRA